MLQLLDIFSLPPAVKDTAGCSISSPHYSLLGLKAGLHTCTLQTYPQKHSHMHTCAQDAHKHSHKPKTLICG